MSREIKFTTAATLKVARFVDYQFGDRRRNRKGVARWKVVLDVPGLGELPVTAAVDSQRAAETSFAEVAARIVSTLPG